MGQQLQVTQSTAAGRRWLSTLIEAMEQAARADLPDCACGRPVPAGLILQLAQPGPTFPVGASRLSLRTDRPIRLRSSVLNTCALRTILQPFSVAVGGLRGHAVSPLRGRYSRVSWALSPAAS